MIYEHRIYHVRWGKMEPLLVGMRQAAPIFEKCGGKLIGAWTTDIGVRPSLVYILAFDDLAAREKFWKDAYSDKVWVDEIGPRALREAVLEAAEISILKPTDFSPLQ